MSGQDCERALSSSLPALSACVCVCVLQPVAPSSAHLSALDLWELVWTVQISDCVSSGLRVPLRSGRRRSGKPVSAQRGNEREELACRRSRQLIHRAARHSEHGPASPRPHMPRWDFTSFVTPPTFQNPPPSTRPAAFIARIPFTSLKTFLLICVVCASTSEVKEGSFLVLFRGKHVFHIPDC